MAEKSGLLNSLRHHKQAISKVEWNRNGTWLLTCGADGRASVLDIRTCKEVYTASTAAGICAAQCVALLSVQMSCDLSLQMASYQRVCICNWHQGNTRCRHAAVIVLCNCSLCVAASTVSGRSQSSDSSMQAARVPLSNNGLLVIPILCFMWLMLISKISVISPTILSAQCCALARTCLSRYSVHDIHQCCRDIKMA